MGTLTAIQWTDSTFNAWVGCTKISPGCHSCYAETLAKRIGVKWGKGKPRYRTSEAYWRQPLIWEARAIRQQKRHRVFCASLADWLDPEVDPQWLADLFGVIARTPHLDWQLLTKRPEFWAGRLAEAHVASKKDPFAQAWIAEWLGGKKPLNVWAGVSTENQKMADTRIAYLVQIPARVRFISAEPLLEFLNLSVASASWFTDEQGEGVDWAIVGGESGPGARRCEYGWISGIIAQARTAGRPVFVKQLGSLFYGANERLRFKHKKGGDIDEWPDELKVRQFPR